MRQSSPLLWSVSLNIFITHYLLINYIITMLQNNWCFQYWFIQIDFHPWRSSSKRHPLNSLPHTHTHSHIHMPFNVCISEYYSVQEDTQKPCLQNYLSPLCPCVTLFPVSTRWSHTTPLRLSKGPFSWRLFNSNILQPWPLGLQGHTGWMRADSLWEKLKSVVSLW